VTEKFVELVDGHAPITLQHAFRDAVEAYEAWPPGASEPTIDYEGRSLSLSAVFNALTGSTDILPTDMLLDVKAYLTKPISSDGPFEETTFSTAARVMNILVRKRLHMGP
jgi:hypothetical protein